MSDATDFIIKGKTLSAFNKKEDYINSKEIQHVEIPSGITTIGAHVFEGYGFDKNELILFDTLVIPEGVKTIQAAAFAWCSIEKLYLPGTLEKVSAGAFAHTNIKELHIALGAEANWEKAFFGNGSEPFESEFDNVYADYETVVGTIFEETARTTFLQQPFSNPANQRKTWLEEIRMADGDKLLKEVVAFANHYNSNTKRLHFLEPLRVILLMGVPTPKAVKKELDRTTRANPEIGTTLTAYLSDYDKLVHGVVEGQPIYTAEQLEELITEDDLKAARKACDDFAAQEAKKREKMKNETRPEKLWKTRKMKYEDGIEVCAYLGCETKAVVPAQIKGNKITSVSFYNRLNGNAKKGLGTLTEIVLEEGIESIEDWAFNGCEDLESVTIPRSVKSIGVGAFDDCDKICVKVYAGSRAEERVSHKYRRFDKNDETWKDMPLVNYEVI